MLVHVPRDSAIFRKPRKRLFAHFCVHLQGKGDLIV